MTPISKQYQGVQRKKKKNHETKRFKHEHFKLFLTIHSQLHHSSMIVIFFQHRTRNALCMREKSHTTQKKKKNPQKEITFKS